jgi:hypothetical protein
MMGASRLARLAAIAICLIACVSPALRAQYSGDQLLGIAGLQAGSLADPGIYVTLPLYFRYSNVSLYGPQGNQVLKNLSGGIDMFVVPAVEVVLPYKILGANYGAAYTEWVSNGLVNVAAINFQRSTGYGFGDIYVQPVILGWHTPHADITTGYSFFAPTGKGSAGFHMWVNELDFGFTVFPDAAKNWNLSTMLYYDFNNRKNNADIKVGEIATVAGGLGRKFLKGAMNAGVAYGAQWKITHDSGADIPAILPVTDGRVFGVGPEISVPVFAKGLNIGLVSFRYLWLVGPKTALGGQTLSASFTFARIIPKK